MCKLDLQERLNEDFFSSRCQCFIQFEHPKRFMKSKVKTLTEKSNRLCLQSIHEHTLQSEKLSICLRKKCTALKFFQFVRRERGPRDDAPAFFLASVSIIYIMKTLSWST